jgi:acetoin utilization deacetylase AcuC-like enzyme
MTTLLITHAAGLEHDMGAGHPERPARLRAIYERLSDEAFRPLARREAPLAAHEALLRVHPETHLQFLQSQSPREGLAVIDPDTLMSPRTLEAALRAAGGAVAAVDAVMLGDFDNAFVAMRPPGHHAERMTAMGFCFLNNAAVAARHAQSVHDAERVAIVDFDVHHGNGTQEIFWSDPTVLYASTHQAPFYPGTGSASERGEFDTIVNVPLRAGDGGDAFRAAMSAVILPRVAAFAPDLVIVSAGFDAHRRDPLGGLAFEEEDFGWATRRLLEIAGRSARGRLISVLEGGYDLQGLAASVGAHVAALLGREGEIRSD